MKAKRTGVNQLLVLSKVFEQSGSPTEMAKDLGLTLQGILYHLRILTESGYIDQTGKITPEGYAFLFTGLKDLTTMISEKLSLLNRDIVWEALAASRISKGESVFLYMKNGYLRASRDSRGKARGVSDRDAEVDHVVGISNVNGIIDLSIGRIDLLLLPKIDAYSTHEIEEKLEEKIGGKKIGVIGEEAFSAVSKIMKIDFEFAALNAAFDAAIRGISSRIFISESRFLYISTELSELSKKYPQVHIGVNSI